MRPESPAPSGAARWRLRQLLCLLGLSCLVAAQALARDQAVGPAAGAVEIRRTTDGIAHVRAPDWRGLGEGIGYAQGQDALCTLAEAFVTYEGRRSWFFGPQQRPATNSSLGRHLNIDSDFFFRHLVDAAAVERMRGAQPAELDRLIEGYAAGYNRQLRAARARTAGPAQRDCLNAPWVREIAAEDLYRRMLAVQMMAGYLQFLPEIANAAPRSAAPAGPPEQQGMAELRERLAGNIAADVSLGSNAIAWGRQATAGDGSVLYGAPHWFWGGPDRFYQMHLSIPGVLNVAGVAFLGVPVVMIGFNEQVAWSHTVSRARRFGLFELRLDPGDPRRYLVDGQSVPMQARTVTVALRDADGHAQTQQRVLYTTRFGPVVDLGRRDPALGWGTARALAVRDINAENGRAFSNFLAWNRAGSLQEFIDIQRRQAAMPWVNTLAIGRGDGRVWYADIGAVPHVPDALRQSCAAPLAPAFARLDPRTPVLDGSRWDCRWQEDPTAAQPGAMPAAQLPGLLREDYVANMNDSHWLANVRAPLEGFASLLGEERQALGLRGRLGHEIALELLQAGASSSQALSRLAMHEVLRARIFSAERFRQPLLDQACAVVPADADPRYLRACQVLRAWDGTGEAQQRGALLWEAFWSALQKRQGGAGYRVPFTPEAPLATPAFPWPGEADAAKALTQAIDALASRGLPLDAAPGQARQVASGGRHWPLYGGCGDVGYFTLACPATDAEPLGPTSIANSYLQVVRFGADGVEAHTLLAHGQDERAVRNGQGSGPVVRHARKQWLKFPFREEDISRDPQLERTLLAP